MKKFFVAPAAIVLSIGLLNACNPLSLLGPIDAPDALGLAGQTMESDVVYVDPAQQLAAKGSTGNASFTFQLNGFKLTDLTIGIKTTNNTKIFSAKLYRGLNIQDIKPFQGTAFSKTLTFDDPKDLPAIPDKLNAALKPTSVSFTGTGCDALPATITAKYTGLSVKISDAKNAATALTSSTDGSVTMTKRADGKYDMTLSPDVTISATGMAAVLGNGTSPNSAEITMAVVYENVLPGFVQCTKTITWGAGKGSYSF